jgi:hypothetical protein
MTMPIPIMVPTLLQHSRSSDMVALEHHHTALTLPYQPIACSDPSKML